MTGWVLDEKAQKHIDSVVKVTENERLLNKRRKAKMVNEVKAGGGSQLDVEAIKVFADLTKKELNNIVNYLKSEII